MRTEIRDMGDKASLLAAKELISRGELVAFATETVYGLGADAFNENAVREIFRAKQRPGDNPLIAHIAGFDDVHLLAESVCDKARILMDAFWPGPLTLILPKRRAVPYAVTANLETVAIRMPGFAPARDFISECGVPIAAPSANRSGLPSPTKAAHVFKDLGGRIPLILDGGSCEIGIESTVLSFAGDTPELLRPGYITLEQIGEVIGHVALSKGVLSEIKAGEAVLSPGMAHRHYSPENARVIVLKGSAQGIAGRVLKAKGEGYKTAAVLFSDAYELLRGESGIDSVNMGGTDEQYAAGLFGALRELDSAGADLIFCQAPGESGVGLALLNRLLRAASFALAEV